MAYQIEIVFSNHFCSPYIQIYLYSLHIYDFYPFLTCIYIYIYKTCIFVCRYVTAVYQKCVFSLSFYIIIIMSRSQHGSPWPSLATRLYHPLFTVGLQGHILYRHRAVVYRFYLVVLPLLVHVKGSTRVCHLWVCPHFSSNVLLVWFI